MTAAMQTQTAEWEIEFGDGTSAVFTGPKAQILAEQFAFQQNTANGEPLEL